MRVVRFMTVSSYPAALALGGLFCLGGCGESGNTAVPGAVKEAPPMTPDEKKVWDENYTAKKAAANKKAGK